MFFISSIGKLQKITKIFTLFYNRVSMIVSFEIIFLKNVKNRSVLLLILLHFDILVNRFLFKNFLYFPFRKKNWIAFPFPGQYTGSKICNFLR